MTDTLTNEQVRWYEAVTGISVVVSLGLLLFVYGFVVGLGGIEITTTADTVIKSIAIEPTFFIGAIFSAIGMAAAIEFGTEYLLYWRGGYDV